MLEKLNNFFLVVLHLKNLFIAYRSKIRCYLYLKFAFKNTKKEMNLEPLMTEIINIQNFFNSFVLNTPLGICFFR